MAPARDVVRAVETGRDLARTGFGVGQSTGQNRDELVAPPAADEIAGAHLTAEPGAQLLQNFVAAQMPEPIVDCLESVDIEQQHAEFLLAFDAGRKFAIQTPGGWRRR